MKILQGMLKTKFKEALAAVLPVVGVVLLLGFTIAPMTLSVFLSFLVGAVLVMIGMMFFTLGAEMSMTTIGEKIGVCMTRTRKLWFIVLVAFLIGVIITLSEPDLQVLATQVPSIPNMTLILSVGLGVGVFLVIALLRILFRIPLREMLVVCYVCVFILAYFVPESFRAVAFDSGGVTTGPMTVPFIMALGVGISSIRTDDNAADDSFGLIALCSVGPIIMVMILGMIYQPTEGSYTLTEIPAVENSVELGKLFLTEIPTYLREIATSLLPIVLFFGAFQLVALKLSRKVVTRILVGLVYTYVGLVLFLTGANVGFMPAGNYLGEMLASLEHPYILIPIGAVLGFFIVRAEPAVYVLNHQVEEITDGAISAGTMGISLSISVAISVALAMIRVLTGISILWFVIPGYVIALLLSYVVPKIFTAIAFDSGGVASGPMTATFLLPLAQGACVAVGGDLVTDAFGVVAMVAMTPLITIQVQGLVYQWKQRHVDTSTPAYAFAALDEDAIIEL